MRRIYRKPYTPPQYLGRKKRGNSSSKELVQPEWDVSTHSTASRPCLSFTFTVCYDTLAGCKPAA
jgi:hypothetical protein